MNLSVEDVVAIEAISPSLGWAQPLDPSDGQLVDRLLQRWTRAPRQTTELVWQFGNDSLPANLVGAWPATYSVKTGDVPVDLAFLRGLPAGAVTDLVLPGGIVAASLAAITHLAPGLRDLDMALMELDDPALALVARLHRLESLRLSGDRFTGQGLSQLAGLRQLRHLNLMVFELDDAALALVAKLPRLESLQMYGGRFTSRRLGPLAGLTKLQTLHVEMDDLEPSWFAFAAMMPNLVKLTGPDETMDQPWDDAQVRELRRMLPGVQVC